MRIREIRDILISAVVLAIAFSIALRENFDISIIKNIPLSLIAVSLSFIFHELGHRTVARKYGCFAEYQMWPLGLVMALGFSLFGFVFAAPGAVMIHPKIDLWGNVVRLSRRKIGLIAIFGPVTNLLLSGIFFLANLIYPSGIFSMGIVINVWLALFNLIPIFPLDGSKVLHWNKKIWFLFFILSIALFVFLSYFLKV